MRPGFVVFMLKTGWLATLGGILYYFLGPTRNEPAEMPKGAQVTNVSEPVGSEPPPLPSATTVKERTKSFEELAVESEQQFLLAASKAKQRDVLGLFDELAEALKSWGEELDLWERTVPPLYDSDAGKRIAGDPELVYRFRALVKQELPTRQEWNRNRDTAEDLISPIRAAFRDPFNAAIPNATISTTLQEARKNAIAASRKWRDVREGVELLLTQAGKPAAKESLRVVITAQEKEETDRRTALIAEATDKQQKSADATLARIEADRVRFVGIEKAKAAAEASKREQEAIVHARLVEQARDPAVQAKFAPFLANGKFLFPKVLASPWWYDRSQPASLSAIQANGYVRNLREFAFTMAGEIQKTPGGNYKPGINDRRPHHPFPRNDDEWAEMERLYKQFTLLAPIWVEIGALAK